MAKHTLTLTLELPDDVFTLDDHKTMARAAGVSLDDWFSRCIVLGAKVEAVHMTDPDTQAYFNEHKALGKIYLDPDSPNLSRYQSKP